MPTTPSSGTGTRPAPPDGTASARAAAGARFVVSRDANPFGDLVQIDPVGPVDGRERLLERAAPGEVPFVDVRGDITVVGVGTWTWERRRVVVAGGSVSDDPPADHRPWLDWLPLGDIGVVYVTTDDDGRLRIVRQHGDTVVVARPLGTGRLVALLRHDDDDLVVVQGDLDATTVSVLTTDLANHRSRSLHGRFVPLGVGPRGVLLQCDEPAFRPARARVRLTDLDVRHQDADGPIAVERRFGRAPDRTGVPIDLVLPPDELRGVMVVSYGCYGQTVETALNPMREALLARGIGYAIARIRGGSDKGERWWAAGRGADKPTAVADLRAAIDDLARLGVPLIGRSFSAGATIQVLAALSAAPDDPRLAGLVVHNPLVRLVDGDGRSLDTEFGDDPAGAGSCLPVSAADAAGRLPPLLVTLGTRDDRTPWGAAWDWCRQATEGGVIEQVQVIVQDADHDGPTDGSAERAALRFIGDVIDGAGR